MPLQYWDDIITQQSWQELCTLNKKYSFVLIGGWAVYVYTKALKSKDIDIVVDFDTLGKLQKTFTLSKNARLKKYEIKELLYDIDIYVEHYSNPGVPAEEILKSAARKEGFAVPSIELLLLLKYAAFKKREGSIKGEKDKIDIFALLQCPIDFTKYQTLLKKYDYTSLNHDLFALLDRTTEIKELGINQQKMAQLKKRIRKLTAT